MARLETVSPFDFTGTENQDYYKLARHEHETVSMGGGDDYVEATMRTLDRGDYLDGGDSTYGDGLVIGGVDGTLKFAKGHVTSFEVLAFDVVGDTTVKINSTMVESGSFIRVGVHTPTDFNLHLDASALKTDQTAILLGWNGDDVLEGGAGRDQFEGAAGNDTLTGGRGFDVFQYVDVLRDQAGGWKDDVITDFNVKQDRIEFISKEVGDPIFIEANDNANGDAVITIWGGVKGDSITLQGVHATDLTSYNFIVTPYNSLGLDHGLLAGGDRGHAPMVMDHGLHGVLV